MPAPPPHPEPARIMAQRVTVIRTGQQVPVPLRELIGHPLTVEATRTSRQDISHTAPKGPFLPGEVPDGT